MANQGVQKGTLSGKGVGGGGGREGEERRRRGEGEGEREGRNRVEGRKKRKLVCPFLLIVCYNL